MTDTAQTEVPKRRRWAIVLVWTLSVVVWILLSHFDIALMLAGLLWAAVVRGIYYGIRRWRKSPVRFVHPWLFFLAGVFALLSFVGQNN